MHGAGLVSLLLSPGTLSELRYPFFFPFSLRPSAPHRIFKLWQPGLAVHSRKATVGPAALRGLARRPAAFLRAPHNTAQRQNCRSKAAADGAKNYFFARTRTRIAQKMIFWGGRDGGEVKKRIFGVAAAAAGRKKDFPGSPRRRGAEKIIFWGRRARGGVKKSFSRPAAGSKHRKINDLLLNPGFSSQTPKLDQL